MTLTSNVAVLGAGSWGTALAHLLAENGHNISLWDRDASLIERIKTNHINDKYLPQITLPENIVAAAGMKEALTPQTDWLVLAVSSGGIRDVVSEASELLRPTTAILTATKGLDPDTAFTTSELIAVLLQDIPYLGLSVLSGPNLAAEVVRRVPSVAVAASDDIEIARGAQQLLMSSRAFRVYTNTDVKGVELAGALKNVLAIAAGISDGLGFGDNTKAALMTRGLMEMTQLGMAAGAKALTFLGIAGVGDLMATAASRLSRNWRVGNGLANHKPLETVLREIAQAAEGVPTAKAARLLARRHNVNTPLFDAIYDIVFAAKSPLLAVEELMSRPAREEFSL